MASRVIAFDCGNTCTGIAIADIQSDRTFNVIHVEVFESNKMFERLCEWVRNRRRLFLGEVALDKCIMVYETTYGGGKNNWNLLRINKALKALFKDEFHIKCRSLKSSQKAIVGGYQKKDRKDKLVEAARRFLHGVQLEEFDRVARKHDIADAVLMARYVFEHDLI